MNKILHSCLLVLSAFSMKGIQAQVDWHVANFVPRSVTSSRTGPFLPNIIVPGNKRGELPQTVPGLALPGQTQNFDHRVPFNPFAHVLDTSFLFDNGDSFGYGLGIHGLNPLNLDVQRLYPLLANSRRVQTADGQFLPWTLGLNMGSEFDFTKKWSGIGGKLDIPILGLNQIFDFTGNFLTKGAGFNQGALDFPLLGTPFRFPLSGKFSTGSGDPQVHYGQAIPNLNLFNIPRDTILQQIANGRAVNPSYLGK